MSLLYRGAQNQTQDTMWHVPTSAKQRKRITFLNLLAAVLLVQPICLLCSKGMLLFYAKLIVHQDLQVLFLHKAEQHTGLSNI